MKNYRRLKGNWYRVYLCCRCSRQLSINDRIKYLCPGCGLDIYKENYSTTKVIARIITYQKRIFWVFWKTINIKPEIKD